MNNIKKKAYKTPLLIDFRPAQNLSHNGVTKATTHWVNEIVRTSRPDQPIYIWTNAKKKPALRYKKKNITHIHTDHSNLKLQLLWFLKLGPSISEITQLQKFIYFCPDIRPQKIDSKCLRIIQYIHDIAYIKHKNSIKTKTRLWFYLCNVKRLYKNADLILTNSNFSKSEIQNQYGSKNISIIHPTLPKNLKQTPIKTDPKYYVIVSTIQKRKNLQQIINLFKNRNETLYIVGANEKMYKKYKLPQSHNIKLLNNITDPQKHYLIKNAIATIYPSQYEGFGLPILESIRLQKNCYTHQIRPYLDLFKNLTTPIEQIFSKGKNISKPSTKIISLKKEVRKLNSHIYRLDGLH